MPPQTPNVENNIISNITISYISVLIPLEWLIIARQYSDCRNLSLEFLVLRKYEVSEEYGCC
jgi:hypothetical protein